MGPIRLVPAQAAQAPCPAVAPPSTTSTPSRTEIVEPSPERKDHVIHKRIRKDTPQGPQDYARGDRQLALKIANDPDRKVHAVATFLRAIDATSSKTAKDRKLET
jgi:hypothetical protein